MVEISEVPGITGSTLELFRAAGIVSVEILLANDVPKIMAALNRANEAYEVAVRPPSTDLVLAWQNAGRAVLRKRAQKSRAAKVVPKENLLAAGIEVSAVPVAKVVEVPAPNPPAAESRAVEASPPPPAAPMVMASTPPSGATECEAKPGSTERKTARPAAKAATPAAKTARPAAKAVAPAAKGAKPAAQRVNVEGTAGEKAEGGPRLPVESINRPSSRREQKEAAENARAEVAAKRFRELEKVRQEKDQGQRRNRGMSHPDATRVRWAATVTVLAPLCSIIAAGILIWALVKAQFYGEHFQPAAALLLLVFPVALLFYLGFGTKARCRLCGQKLFVPKHCRKHVRASKSIFGYTFAVARNAMLFANYRCMYCGTKTRLKD